MDCYPPKNRWYEKHKKRFAIVVTPFVLVILLFLYVIVHGVIYGPTLQEQEKQLEYLAYIKIMTAEYSDNTDPEYEGVAIAVMYYDNKSEHIDFTNVPMNVVIELYGYHDISDTFDHNKMELVHKESITIDHSMGLGEMFGKYIRIPFDGISVDPKEYYEYGTIKVTVEMLGKGNFSDRVDLVTLCTK